MWTSFFVFVAIFTVVSAQNDSCDRKTCMMECTKGFKLDTYGCPTCECNPECDNKMCMMECTNGFKLDNYGCFMCECNAECDNKMCMMECANGFKKDNFGCNTCECNPECDNKMCMMECTNGFKKDNFGCDTCECNPECDNKMCMMECARGFRKDANGCDTCECMPEPELYVDPCKDISCNEGTECKTFKLTSSGHEIPRCVDPSLRASCQPPMDSGPCKAAKPRWHYNADKNTCEAFDFGGCEGNTNNYKTERACQLTCVPGTIPEDGECPALNCPSECPDGHEKDDKGCDTCTCIGACSQLSCMMECPAGFKKDSRGCNTCECKKEKCPSTDLCGLSCNMGFAKDKNGCTLCKCSEKVPCVEGITCNKECKFGFRHTTDGCTVCDCAPSQCQKKVCDKEHECKVTKNQGKWEAKCVSYHESRAWCNSTRPVCAMECEHGYVHDQYGCTDQCNCLESLPKCTLQECTESCTYGNMYDRNGCKTCECLENPCKIDSCPDACEAMSNKKCPSCPARIKCLEQLEVNRVSVSLTYFYEGDDDEIEKEDIRELERICSDNLQVLTGVKRQHLHGLKVSVPAPSSIAVEFHIISFGDYNLVEVYQQFKDKITNHEENTVMLYGETQLIPEKDTLAVQYSSEREVPQEDIYEEDVDSDDMTQTITIVAAIAAGCVALIVVVIVIFAVVRSKTKHKPDSKNRNVIYKKAPNKEQGDRMA